MRTVVGALASLSRRFPRSVVVGAVALTALFGQFAGQVTVASGNEGFAPEGPEISAAERIGDKFGEDSQESAIQIVVLDQVDVITVEGLRVATTVAGVISESEVGPKIADRPERPGILHYLMGVEQAMTNEGLTIEDMSDEMVKEFFRASVDPTQTPPEEASFILRLVSQGYDPDSTTAEGGMVLAFVNTFDGEPEEAFNAQMDAERAMAEDLAQISTSLEIRPFSFPLLLTGVDDFTQEVGRLFGLAFTVILVLLLFVYWLPPGTSGTWLMSVRRTVADALLSLLAVVMAIAWMQGIGYLLEQVGVITAFSAPTQIVPILLVALGIDYAIHLNSRYREEIGSGLTVDEAVGRAVRTVGISLVLATITTVIGFLTNLVNPVPALTDFGILAAVGIASSFLLMLTFVPAVRILADRRAERRGALPTGSLADHGNRLIPRLMQGVAVLALRAPVATLIVAISLGAAGYYGFSQLETRFSFTDFLPEDSDYVATMDLLQTEFGGGFGEQTRVLVEATPERGVDAGVHNALVAANADLVSIDEVSTVDTEAGPVANALSPIGLLGQMLSMGPEATPPVLLEAAGEVGLGDDLTVAAGADVGLLYRAMFEVDPEAAARVIHFEGDRLDALLWDISTSAGERVANLRAGLGAAFAGVRESGASAVATSDNIIGDSVVIELTESQARSLVITLAVAGLVLMINFLIESRRPFLGVITIAPVALVVLWTYGLMYALGIPFGPVTATLAALSIGIGVPFTIHIARRFQEERASKDTIEEAMRAMMRHTGGALAGSAFTTIAGFGVLMTASLVPFRQMGQVTSFAIALCLVAAVAVLPSMLALWDRYHRRRDGRAVAPSRNEAAAPSGKAN